MRGGGRVKPGRLKCGLKEVEHLKFEVPSGESLRSGSHRARHLRWPQNSRSRLPAKMARTGCEQLCERHVDMLGTSNCACPVDAWKPWDCRICKRSVRHVSCLPLPFNAKKSMTYASFSSPQHLPTTPTGCSNLPSVNDHAARSLLTTICAPSPRCAWSLNLSTIPRPFASTLTTEIDVFAQCRKGCSFSAWSAIAYPRPPWFASATSWRKSV